MNSHNCLELLRDKFMTTGGTTSGSVGGQLPQRINHAVIPDEPKAGPIACALFVCRATSIKVRINRLS